LQAPAGWKHKASRFNVLNAWFFPLHDLTRFAVKSVLGTRQGFYGPIARGWDIGDSTGKGTKGPLPDEALAIEHLVGMLDAERAGGSQSPAAELNEHGSVFASRNGLPLMLNLTERNLEKIRSTVKDLQARWISLAAGETMTLAFETAD